MGSILITGGAGYIGSHAAWALLDQGLEPVVMDDLSSGLRAAVPPAAAFVQEDVTDARAIARVLRKCNVEAVLHFAATVVPSESTLRPLDHHRVNTGGVIALLRACVEAGVNRVVLSSTAAVYGDAQAHADESAPTRPISPYGRSKLAAEAVLADAAAAHGLRTAAFRYFNVAGADPEGRAGQSRSATHLFKAACEVALGEKAVLDVFGDDWPTRDGTGIRDYVHVSDIVRAHVLVLGHLADSAPGKSLTLNLGSEQGHTVREIAAAVSEAAGHAVPMCSAARRPGDMAELIADASRARDLLGWSPRFGVREIAAHAFAWELKKRGYGPSLV